MLTVDLRPGSRPARLRARVDEAFFRFADGLPPGLRALAYDQRTFSGRSEAAEFSGPSRLNPVIAGAPWLFWRGCRRLPAEQLLPIAEAGALLGATYAILDHLVDDQVAEPAGAALLAQACFERALHLLYGEFAAGAPFWGRFERLWAELRQSQAAERQWQLAPGAISLEEFRQAARAKAAPAAITLAAFVEAGAGPALFELGAESLMEFGAAAQLAHDVGDWRADVAEGHTTYFLSRVAAGERLSMAEALERIDAGWLDVDYLRLAEGWLSAAQRDAEELGCPAWRDYLRRSWAILDEELTRCLAGHVVRVGLQV